MQQAGHSRNQPSAVLPENHFTAASYNIHQAIGTDRRHDRHRIVRVIKQLDADVIGLQEVDTNPDGDEMFQLDFFARQTGLKAIAGHTMRRRDSDYGNVLLTRHKIIDVRNIDLSVPRREPRGAIDADLEIAGVAVRVIVTHFGLSSRERFYQGEQLVKAVAHRRDAMVVVLSDLNEWHRYGRTSRSIKTHFGRSVRLRTFPSWMPIFALDRVWVWPENALVSTRVHRQAPAPQASDHLPITATISTAVCARP
jgi:endonuclease/exonuclease/phosphatase family metal-dependent hydrolase